MRKDEAPRLEFRRDPELGGSWMLTARYARHRFERHLHDEMVIAVTEGGHGTSSTRHGSQTAYCDTVLVFEPGEYHDGYVEPESHWHYRAFYLDLGALAALAAVFYEGRGDGAVVPHGLYVDRELAQQLLAAHRRMQERASLLERQSLWWSAMGLLFRRYGQPKPPALTDASNHAGLARARAFIEEHAQRNLSVECLAEVAGLSRYHFLHAFRREFGLPPHAYANQRRLIEAKRLLAAGEPASRVAEAVGFYDQSHLNRYFKRAYGITPGTYAAQAPYQRKRGHSSGSGATGSLHR